MQALATAAAEGRRSKLFLWMYTHHAEFEEAVLKRAGRPNWKRIALELEKIRWLGDPLTNLAGKPASGEQARQIWLQVRKALEREALESKRAPLSAAQPRADFFPEPASERPADEDDFSDIDRALGKTI